MRKERSKVEIPLHTKTYDLKLPNLPSTFKTAAISYYFTCFTAEIQSTYLLWCGFYKKQLS